MTELPQPDRQRIAITGDADIGEIAIPALAPNCGWHAPMNELNPCVRAEVRGRLGRAAIPLIFARMWRQRQLNGLNRPRSPSRRRNRRTTLTSRLHNSLISPARVLLEAWVPTCGLVIDMPACFLRGERLVSG